MTINRWVAAGVGLVLAVLVGFALGRLVEHAPTTPVNLASRAVPSTPDAPPAPRRPARHDAAPTASTDGFVYQQLLVDTSRAAPEACLQFSEALAEDPGIHYADYLKVEPAAKLAVRVAGARLCLGGLEFRYDYRVTIAAELPAASGARSREPQTVAVSLGEQPTSVTFGSNGFILPRQGTDGVGIQTVNVDKVRLKVRRVGDRILARTKFLQSQGDSNWYWREVAPDATTVVWSGEMTVERVHNQRVTTMFPLADVLKARRPGAYLIEADISKPRRANGGEDDDAGSYYWGDEVRQHASQWVIDTDVALTSLRGADGLHVFARSLDTAMPLADVVVTLIAVNNDELGRAVTDKSGHAAFAPGLLRGKAGAAPSVVMAFGLDADFAVLDLKRPAFDLSDRGVSGRAAPGAIDAFLYTDRGIYRLGETVQLTALVRDRVAAAIDGTPITLTINRPDGVTFKRLTLDGAKAGGLTVPLMLADTAARGVWSAVASLGKSTEPVGRVEFDVQDFVPQRLKVTLKTDATVLRVGEPAAVSVNGRFLYGAPGADLNAEGELKLVPEREPFADYKGYRVGLFDDAFKEQTLPLRVANTSADGTTHADAALGELPATTLPLRATIRIGLFEPGGRITSDRLQLPVATKPLVLGVRPRFADERVEENSLATFDLRAFDSAGNPTAHKAVHYEFVDENWDYNWFFNDGRWQFQTVVRDRPLASGTLDVEADKPAELSQKVGWGHYRLTVSDPDSGAATSLRFRGGWQSTVDASDTPDKVEVTVAAPQYRVGETARVNIRPPFAGELLLTIASDKVFETRTMSIPAEGATVDVKTAAEWGTGAYVLASFYRPLASGRPRDVVRAIGLAWIGLDLSDRTLGVALKLPDLARPRQTVTVDLKLDHMQPNEPTYLTLAAVDEGILQLTRFASPAPQKYYFGKRRLAVDIRDDYARLLDGIGTVGRIRSGGDGMGGRGLPVVPTKSVALFSGIVAVGADGMAHVPLELPDFNGQLRVMAVAFSKSAVGGGEANAYGAYVLARSGMADIGELRYMHDRFGQKMRSPVALGHLGAALALMGDRARASDAFERARAALGYKDAHDYYQSPLRDAAALAALAAEAGQSQLLQAVVAELDTLSGRATWRSTQEQAWLLMAAAAMIKGAGPVTLAVNDLAPAALAMPTSFKPTIEQVRHGFTVGNRGEGGIWRSLVIHGAPKEAPPALSNGLTIEKSILSLDGAPLDLAQVHQNDRVIVSIKGRALRRGLVPAVLVDMLPAGFEIEAMLLRGENGKAPYDFLPMMNVTRTREARDDRFVAAFDLNSRDDDYNNGNRDIAAFHVAYVARAVTPGTFTLPAASVEDMYKPEVMARTEVKRVTIQAR